MKFGKLTDISQVDFTLAKDPAENRVLLKQLSSTKEEGLYIFLGLTGWSMPVWKGKWYPAKAKTGDFLLHYGKQFNSIELNTTHYRIPDEASIQRWKAQTPNDFRFCPKVPQSISHHKNLGLGTDLIPAFTNAVQRLDEKLGHCFIQLPPYFDYQSLGKIEYFLKAWPKSIPLAVEVRHESWFAAPEHAQDYFSLLEQHNAAAVISDVAGRRDVAHMRLTANSIMVRFVGNGLHPSDYTRADAWISRILDWHELGLNEVYFFPHQPDNILAPEMATYFAAAFAKHDFIHIRGPQEVAKDSDGQQMSLF